MFLIAGLGNPGKQYALTRHNAGFIAADLLANYYDLSWQHKQKFNADLSSGIISEKKLILCKPMAYMNLSGDSVASIANYYKIPPANIIIFHDDIELACARIKYKFGGSSAGHNGLKSIDQILGTRDYHRIRIGVGKPKNPNLDVVNYVLDNFSSQELELIKQQISKIIKNIDLLFAGEIEKFKMQI